METGPIFRRCLLLHRLLQTHIFTREKNIFTRENSTIDQVLSDFNWLSIKAHFMVASFSPSIAFPGVAFFITRRECNRRVGEMELVKIDGCQGVTSVGGGGWCQAARKCSRCEGQCTRKSKGWSPDLPVHLQHRPACSGCSGKPICGEPFHLQSSCPHWPSQAGWPMTGSQTLQ